MMRIIYHKSISIMGRTTILEITCKLILFFLCKIFFLYIYMYIYSYIFFIIFRFYRSIVRLASRQDSLHACIPQCIRRVAWGFGLLPTHVLRMRIHTRASPVVRSEGWPQHQRKTRTYRWLSSLFLTDVFTWSIARVSLHPNIFQRQSHL